MSYSVYRYSVICVYSVCTVIESPVVDEINQAEEAQPWFALSYRWLDAESLATALNESCDPSMTCTWRVISIYGSCDSIIVLSIM